ncbi:MAG TPA: hypothetical protein VGO92_02895, partial [Acidimicrobiales bacterium]|nr:hypothetical protein [Acidimicrobiales bacterium]
MPTAATAVMPGSGGGLSSAGALPLSSAEGLLPFSDAGLAPFPDAAGVETGITAAGGTGGVGVPAVPVDVAVVVEAAVAAPAAGGRRRRFPLSG